MLIILIYCVGILIEYKGSWRLPNDRLYTKLIPGFAELSERGRKRAMAKFLDSCEVVQTVKPPFPLTNTPRKIRDAFGNNLEPTSDQYRIGVETLLALPELYEVSQSGNRILAYLLSGMRCKAIRKAVPDLRFAVSTSDQSDGTTEIMSAIAEACVTMHHWNGKNCRVKRKAIIDCRSKSQYIGYHFHDYSRVILRAPKVQSAWQTSTAKKKIVLPIPYTDTIACILGADSAFLREADEYMQNSCVFLIGCGKNEWGSARLSPDELSHYAPAALQALRDHRYEIAAVLREWWSGAEDENQWAAEIVADARASFGSPDSRYISVTLDPKKLREAVAYRVLLSFLDFVVERGWLTAEQADTHRAGAKAVFDPDPIEEKPVRRMEQLDVFSEIMSTFLEDASTKIVPLGERFVKADKAIGAYREIGGEKFLVMPEGIWARTYLQAARKAGFETSFAQQANWERELQKLLGEAGVIKQPSAGFRYRYDLFDNGTRDKTYVLALPIGK